MRLQPADPELDRVLKRLARRSPADIEGVFALMPPLAEAEARARLAALAKPAAAEPEMAEVSVDLLDSGFSPWLRALLHDEPDQHSKQPPALSAATSLLRTCATELARADAGAAPQTPRLALSDRIAGFFRRGTLAS